MIRFRNLEAATNCWVARFPGMLRGVSRIPMFELRHDPATLASTGASGVMSRLRHAQFPEPFGTRSGGAQSSAVLAD